MRRPYCFVIGLIIFLLSFSAANAEKTGRAGSWQWCLQKRT